MPKKKPGTTIAVEAVETTKASKKPIPGISRHEADAIQARIRESVERTVQNYAKDIIEIAKDLREIKLTNAWAYYTDSWTSYLEEYREFSRSYMFNLAKLGQAGDETLQKLLDMGLGATQLVEYARLAPAPEQIAPLVEETWDSVKELPVKDLAKKVKEKALAYQQPKKPVEGTPRGRKPKSWLEQFKELHARIPIDQRSDFAEAVRGYLKTPAE